MEVVEREGEEREEVVERGKGGRESGREEGSLGGREGGWWRWEPGGGGSLEDVRSGMEKLFSSVFWFKKIHTCALRNVPTSCANGGGRREGGRRG